MGGLIGGATRLAGLIGWPVSHSLSPAMHNAAAAALGLDLVYVPLPVRPAEVAAAVRGLAALGFLGANVTVPHKQAVLLLLDEIDPAARAIGAVNTIRVERPAGAAPSPARLVGYNTDWSGFLADLQALGVDVAGRACLVLGAGGSARAVAYALASAGGRVHVLARRVVQAQALVQNLALHFLAGSLTANAWDELAELSQEIAPAVIANTTPLGMTPQVESSPWPVGLPFPGNSFVYDLVYNPAETRFMQQARAAGRPAANGLGMLVRQGAQAFRLWTGLEPDIEVMTAALHAVKRPELPQVRASRPGP